MCALSETERSIAYFLASPDTYAEKFAGSHFGCRSKGINARVCVCEERLEGSQGVGAGMVTPPEVLLEAGVKGFGAVCTLASAILS